MRSLDGTTKKEFHAKCCKWYSKQTITPGIIIEHIFHLTRSGEIEKAAELVAEEGRSLIAQGHMELLGLMEDLPISELEKIGTSTSSAIAR